MGKKYNIEEIIEGCKNKQPIYQRALVDGFSDLLYSISLRYVGHPATAQDVLQEAFIRIFKAFKNYDSDKGSLSAWMRKITVNEALKSLNKKKVKYSTLSVDFNEKYGVAPEILRKMDAEDLLKVVQSLPEGYRQVFNLSVIEGYSHKEISQLLGIQPVSSRSNLSRAKQILRKKLNSFKNSETWVRTN